MSFRLECFLPAPSPCGCYNVHECILQAHSTLPDVSQWVRRSAQHSVEETHAIMRCQDSQTSLCSKCESGSPSSARVSSSPLSNNNTMEMLPMTNGTVSNKDEEYDNKGYSDSDCESSNLDISDDPVVIVIPDSAICT